jgi:hypothetical protein
MPMTFKDAIMVTRNLGIRYLWIDSLCILQDSEADWAIEASRMADIYRYSTLTIAASSSMDCTKGFLLERRSFGFNNGASCSLPMPLTALPCDQVLLQPRYACCSFGQVITSHFQGPLNSRAWALQERILSYRIASYDKDQIFWECNSSRYLEGWTIELSSLSRLTSRYFAALAKPYTESSPSEQISWTAKNTKPYAKYEQWYKMLEEYRARKLTYHTDALPALSGLARNFSSRTGDTYLAGIWWRDLFRGLSWCRDWSEETVGLMPKDLEANFEKIMQSRPQAVEQCYAPSWSWASLQHGRIRSTSNQDIRSIIELPTSLQPTFISWEIIPRNADRMGHVKSGHLSIEGSSRLVDVFHTNSYGKHNPYGQYSGTRHPYIFEMQDMEPKSLNQHLRPAIDYPLWFEEKTKSGTNKAQVCLTCLVLCMSKLASFNILHCLLLHEREEQGGKEYYQRCGMLDIRVYDPKMLVGWDRKTFHIV